MLIIVATVIASTKCKPGQIGTGVTVVKRNIFNVTTRAHAAFLQDAPSELWQRRSLSGAAECGEWLLGRDEPRWATN
ncbi:hypothetical protein H7I76_34145 [Mycolicibacterium vaccae]|nr:hypothetical protein [Mycolicibacterium vaccae]